MGFRIREKVIDQENDFSDIDLVLMKWKNKLMFDSLRQHDLHQVQRVFFSALDKQTHPCLDAITLAENIAPSRTPEETKNLNLTHNS